MKILAVCRPLVRADRLAPHLDAELAALRELSAAGILLEAYTGAGPGAVLLLETASAADADQALTMLPLRTAGLIEVEIIELRPIPLQ